mgnify:FL=1
MRFHLLQHAAFEGPAAIQDWIRGNDHTLTTTKLYRGDLLPSLSDFDFLIVMGGPMGVEEIQQYPWLAAERGFIRQSIDADKYMLGICLGAQLIARACGAKVTRNIHREIGWFDVTIENQYLPEALHDVFPVKKEVFHWHSDTFEIPEDASHFAASQACSNQGFILNGRVIGLQFHIETTADSAALLVKNCGEELDGSLYVQSASEILADSTRFIKINQLLSAMMDNLTGQADVYSRR